MMDPHDEPENPSHPQKRKSEDQENGSSSKKQKQPAPPRQNTAVYITGLPLDATADEIESVFCRFGIIAEAVETGEKRIKLYKDDEGNFKGEALVIYFRPESVQLAIDMRDDSDFRWTPGTGHAKMRVQAADLSFKRHQDTSELPARHDRNYKAKVSKMNEKLNRHALQMLIRHSKLADWDDDDPQTVLPPASRHDKIVVLRHMFTLKELEEDDESYDEIYEDILSECKNFGKVKEVALYDKEPDGVATVRFAKVADAEKCVERLQGRKFSERPILASIADGEEDFKKSERKPKPISDDKRLEQFGEMLEESGDEE